LNQYQGQDYQIIVKFPKVECSVAEIAFEKDYFVDDREQINISVTIVSESYGLLYYGKKFIC
jgi:hypothetical protein